MTEEFETTRSIDAFFLAEFNHLSDSYRENEILGERRAAFFVGLATAISAGVGFLINDLPDDISLWVLPALIAAPCLALLFMGWAVHTRLVHRNVATDQLIEGMRRIREWFCRHDESALDYLIFPPTKVKPERTPGYSLGKGGWLVTVRLIVCAMFGGMALALALIIQGWLGLCWVWPALLMVPISAIGSWRYLSWRAKKLYHEEYLEKVSGLVGEKDGKEGK